MDLLSVIARYYVLTREQAQQIQFPDHQSGRSTRKHLTRLRQAGYIVKHRVPVALPDTNTAAPVYYPTKQGAKALASYFDDDSFLATNTRHPRADRLAHWISINGTRLIIEKAIAQQTYVTLEKWVTEWEVINKAAAAKEQFCLHVQFSEQPPLSCSPDAAILLSVAGSRHKKVFYLEQDLGTSSPKQNAARKTKGYAELASRQNHRQHFPETTLPTFSVLMVTTNEYRCKATAKEVSKRPRPDLWRFINQKELTPETFLHGLIVYDHTGEVGPLVKPTTDSALPELVVSENESSESTT